MTVFPTKQPDLLLLLFSVATTLSQSNRIKEKAKALLAEAGYSNGFKTKIVTTARYDKGAELAEVLSTQFKEIGVEAEIEVLEWSVLEGVLAA